MQKMQCSEESIRMALKAVRSPSAPISFTRTRAPLLLSFSVVHKFAVRCENQKSAAESEPASPSPSPSPSPGVGFGPRRKQQQKRSGGSVVRRSPVAVERPGLISKSKENEGKNESAFLLAWLGLGGVILVQGIALAASGFLPEEWDRFFVKYVYPSFTPTVALFVAGTVAYGVLKYLQNDQIQIKDKK